MVPAVDINYWAVLASAVAANVIGGLWYSPVLFGKAWMKLSGLDGKKLEELKKKSSPGKVYALMFVGSLVMAYVLSHFIDYTQATTVFEGAQAGFWVWIGFVATVQLGSMLWEGKPAKLYFLNTGYQLVSLLTMGIILAVWV